MLRGEALRRLVAEGAVGTGGVVVLAEVFDDACFGERPKLLPVETLVAEAAVDTLHKAAFPRTGGRDIDRFDVMVGQPAIKTNFHSDRFSL